jgi:hypothetical protein
MTSGTSDHQGTTERSTSGTVRRRRTVRRGPATGGDDAGDEFVKVRSVAEEPADGSSLMMAITSCRMRSLLMK